MCSSSRYKSESMTVAGNFITSVAKHLASFHIPEANNLSISSTVIFIYIYIYIYIYINIVKIKVILKICKVWIQRIN